MSKIDGVEDQRKQQMQKHKAGKCIAGMQNCELHNTIGTKQNGKEMEVEKGDCSQVNRGDEGRTQECVMLQAVESYC